MRVYVAKRDIQYPNSQFGFAPSQHYPEYLWDDISPEENSVYDMVRECLHGYGLDEQRYNTPQWNPLSEIICPGDTVVLKPNWVEDKNENSKAGLDCVVTHASVIRAMIDYVYLALRGSGKIIIGDSAMPDCNLEKLMKVARYDAIWDSCKSRSINITVMDFREDVVTGFGNAVVKQSKNSEIIVDLGNDSFFADSEYNIGRYRNGIVDATDMNTFYHQVGHHRYGINKSVLCADVIINLPKPKSHRKAGYTAALKNYVGICSVKRSIPHNVTGNVKEGGDTYFGPKIIFETEQRIRDLENRYQANDRRWRGIGLKCSRIPFYLFRRLTHKKYFGTGNWYRNDTIWRSILDLNRIMIYADRNGIMQDSPQRKFFSLGDMIISGERNGPLAPSAKKCGILLCAENPIAFDLTVVRIMGFKYEMLPVLNRAAEAERYCLPNVDSEEVMVASNLANLHGKPLNEIPEAISGYFQPAEGWDVISNNGC